MHSLNKILVDLRHNYAQIEVAPNSIRLNIGAKSQLSMEHNADRLGLLMSYALNCDPGFVEWEFCEKRPRFSGLSVVSLGASPFGYRRKVLNTNLGRVLVYSPIIEVSNVFNINFAEELVVYFLNLPQWGMFKKPAFDRAGFPLGWNIIKNGWPKPEDCCPDRWNGDKFVDSIVGLCINSEAQITTYECENVEALRIIPMPLRGRERPIFPGLKFPDPTRIGDYMKLHEVGYEEIRRLRKKFELLGH